MDPLQYISVINLKPPNLTLVDGAMLPAVCSLVPGHFGGGLSVVKEGGS